MAGIKLIAQTQELATGTAKRTMLQIGAPANQRLKIKEWGVSFDGTNNAAEPVLVQLVRQTNPTGVAGDTLTPVLVDPGVQETIQSSALENIDSTTQPTDGDELDGESVHPQGGYTWQAPFGDEYVVPGGGYVGIAVTAAEDVNIKARIAYEE